MGSFDLIRDNVRMSHGMRGGSREAIISVDEVKSYQRPL
jgi:hypothetical protein